MIEIQEPTKENHKKNKPVVGKNGIFVPFHQEINEYVFTF
jgi:hypothetical protein